MRRSDPPDRGRVHYRKVYRMSDPSTIYSILEQVGDVTIEELASLTRMSKTRVRRALKQLDDDGAIALDAQEQEHDNGS